MPGQGGHVTPKIYLRRAPVVLAGLLVLTVLAACQPPATTIPIGPTRVVDIGKVVDAFQDICLRTAPTFRGARARFARHGFVNKQANSIVYDETGTISIRIDDVDTARGALLRCSIVYEDPNRFIAVERIDQMLRKVRRNLGPARGASFPKLSGGERPGRAWSYRAGGRQGDLLDVPHDGGNDLGVLILQFPEKNRN